MKKSVEQDKPKAARNKNRRKYKRKKNAKQAKRAIEKGLQSGEECFVGQNRAASVPNNNPNFNHRTVPHHPRMKNAQNIWIKTYQNIIKWHSQHQMNYWKQHALKLRVENARLKRRLTVQDSEDEDDAEAEVREAQQSQQQDEDQEDEALDEEFIAFMEVSARHRLERRRLKNESVH
ncbi:uncharacterized protein LOC120426272 isoform X1 [Culex pipiens pallens]|uniref:uncharacterized protein LOC120426272 isoform X1 n=1 Tax=Culex pipiens pallens TaxID=42434 RepID=UPI00195324BA|nr:uncharacterized protein LOC120426272 isoform X1 [Culex pipiens pallens]